MSTLWTEETEKKRSLPEVNRVRTRTKVPRSSVPQGALDHKREMESMPALIDLTGHKYGRLTVLEMAPRVKGKGVEWVCRCDCGKEAVVLSNSLRRGNTKSCGCLFTEMLVKRNTKHGHARRDNKTRLYGIWVRMRQRCSDSNSSDYERYGGRGIKVCDEWNDFGNFHDWAHANGYKKHLTIERINNDGDYEPTNCKWVAPEKQARNKRNNRFIEFRGQKKTLAEWSEITGIDSSLLRYRLKRWSVEEALTTGIREDRYEDYKINA